MRKAFAVCALLLAPALGFAQDQECQYSKDIDLTLNTDGATAIVFNVGSHDLLLFGAPRADGAGSVTGRACASRDSWVPKLNVRQYRIGTKLVVDLKSTALVIGRGNYAYLDIESQIPDDVAVHVNSGSGMVHVSDVASLNFNVASGVLEGENIPGTVVGNMASGRIEFQNVGALLLASMASGVFSASQVNGPATLSAVASGVITLSDVTGPVRSFAVASGVINAQNVVGNVTVDYLGAGQLYATDIEGNLVVRSKARAGKVQHSNVSGTVNIPR